MFTLNSFSSANVITNYLKCNHFLKKIFFNKFIYFGAILYICKE